MIYGYVRVSSLDQNSERQLKKMRELGIPKDSIFEDKKSGKDFDRPQYQAMRKLIQDGDLIYIDALDRLGRDYDGIISEWKYITRELNADIIVLENETLFDSRKFKAMGDMGKLMEDQFLSLLSYVADQERKKIKQRQAEGVALAKKAGKYKGRVKKYTQRHPGMNQAVEWFQEGKKTVKEICEITKVSRSALYRELQDRDIKRA